MINQAETNRERRYRGALARNGFELRKSRARTISADNLGGYMIVHAGTNSVAFGERYNLDLDDVRAWMADVIEHSAADAA